MLNTMKAMIRKLRMALMKEPRSMPLKLRPPTSVPLPPVARVMIGLMTSSIRDAHSHIHDVALSDELLELVDVLAHANHILW